MGLAKFMISIIIILLLTFTLKISKSNSQVENLEYYINKYENEIENKGVSSENYICKGKEVVKKALNLSWDYVNPYDIAIHLFKKAISLEANNQEAHYWLGVAYQKHEGPQIPEKVICSLKYTKLASDWLG